MIDLTTIPFTITKKKQPLLTQECLPPEEKNLVIAHTLPLLEKHYQPILLSDFREYMETGNRSHYQAMVEERNQDLADLAFAQYFDLSDRFLPAILDLIYLITSEIAWWLPAHNQYQRDVPVNDYPDTTNPIICLHAGETAALLSIVVTILKNRLPEEAIEHVKQEIEKRIFTPYESFHFWWMGEPTKPVNNWGPWCTQSVLLCYYLLSDNKKRKAKAINLATATLTSFLSGYGEDGCCEEGASYYHHAGVTFFGAVTALQWMTDNAFSTVFEDPTVRAMAAYIEKVHIADDWYCNFADSSAKGERNGITEYLFAKATHNPDLMAFTSNDWMRDTKDNQLRLSNRYSLERVLTYQHYQEATKQKGSFVHQEGTTHFPSTGLHIFRTKNFMLAVSAGNNGVSHNHNDTGSIILFKEGQPVLIDIGVGVYTAKTFSKERYTIWTMQDQYHNLTSFPPFAQLPGAEYRATAIEATDNTITMELKDAYDPKLNLESYRRTITIEEDKVTITDQVKTTQHHLFTMISAYPPQRTEKGIAIGNATLTFTGKPEYEEMTLEDEKLQESWTSGKIYRTRIPYDESFTMTIK